MGERLIEPLAAQEYFVNGFCDYTVIDGVMTCAGYRLQPRKGKDPFKVVVVRLAFPVTALEAAITSARQAQAARPEVRSSDRVVRHH